MPSEFRPRELSKDASLDLPADQASEARTPITRERVQAGLAGGAVLAAGLVIAGWLGSLMSDEDIRLLVSGAVIFGVGRLSIRIYRVALKRLDPTQVKPLEPSSQTCRSAFVLATVFGVFGLGAGLAAFSRRNWLDVVVCVVVAAACVEQIRVGRRLSSGRAGSTATVGDER